MAELPRPQSDDSFHAGFDLYCARPDKGYSLTGCISMQVMRREALTEVLTSDRHLEQEGLRDIPVKARRPGRQHFPHWTRGRHGLTKGSFPCAGNN
jgi:hypothetical protein